LITAVRPLDEAPAAYAAATGPEIVKILMRMN
jgi:hypothetical protein